MKVRLSIFLFFFVFALHAQENENLKSNEAIAKASQNPLTAIYSIPVQDNIYMNIGKGVFDGYPVKNMANIQPVIPLSLSPKVDVVMRLILPVTTVPSIMTDGTVSTTGIGDMTLTAFFTPHKANKVLWGIGPVLYFPTATNKYLGGTKKWAAGPSLVMMFPLGKFNAGFLLMNFWSYAGSNDVIDGTFSFMQIQPFLNYNLKDGWFISSVPIITANWNMDKNNRWTLPAGAGVGKAFKLFGVIPASAQFHAYYSIVSPEVFGERWQMRVQAQIFLPRKKK